MYRLMLQRSIDINALQHKEKTCKKSEISFVTTSHIETQ